MLFMLIFRVFNVLYFYVVLAVKNMEKLSAVAHDNSEVVDVLYKRLFYYISSVRNGILNFIIYPALYVVQTPECRIFVEIVCHIKMASLIWWLFVY
jgi:hypothetical protein